MANIRGKGGATERNIIGTAQLYQNKETGKPPYYVVDAQMDQRDPKTIAAKDTNPHLESHKFTTKDGQERVAHGKPYTQEQFNAIKEAGDTIELPDGKIGFAVKANVFNTKDKEGKTKGLLVNWKGPMSKSDFDLSPEAFTQQKETTAAVKAAVEQERAAEQQGAQMEAPEVQQEKAEDMAFGV